MLEKNINIFCDAHFHFSNSLEINAFDIKLTDKWKGCSCSHSKEEWKFQESNIDNPNIIKAYGLHPQSAAQIDIKENLDFLEYLCQNHLIGAIGEAGFDFFTDDYIAESEKQNQMFLSQLEVAINYSLPVVIHCRKANEKLFEYSSLLKKLPSVLFHSFMGTSIEAKSLLNRNINGYFSFGKQMLNNNKKVIECCKNLPLENLLCETDAPYQYLKNEKMTFCTEIKSVYKALIDLRKTESSDALFSQLEKNFNALFLIK